jgi:hypothetical protein
MNAQLERSGWPVLDGMFSRDAMMARLRAGDLGMMKRVNFGVFFARAEALLLMTDGPSDALESQLAFALDNVMSTRREQAERFDAWVRAEAALA